MNGIKCPGQVVKCVTQRVLTTCSGEFSESESSTSDFASSLLTDSLPNWVKDRPFSS